MVYFHGKISLSSFTDTPHAPVAHWLNTVMSQMTVFYMYFKHVTELLSVLSDTSNVGSRCIIPGLHV